MIRNIIKILMVSCMLFVFSGNVSAQWRFGYEYNYPMMQKFHYSSDGVFGYKDLNVLAGMSHLFTAEYILPRKWTPNWMALSIRAQFGGGFYDTNTEIIDGNIGDFFGKTFYDDEPVGLMIPIDLEVKFLLNNHIRFYVNGGVPNFINLVGNYVYDSEHNDYDTQVKYKAGYEFGLGFEFACFRVGYKNVNYNNSFLPENKGNKYNNIHTFTASFIFNGNRFLKKKSSLKAF